MGDEQVIANPFIIAISLLLSNAPKFFLLWSNYAPSCSIMLHKLLLSESNDKFIPLTTFISKQLRALNFTVNRGNYAHIILFRILVANFSALCLKFILYSRYVLSK